MTGVADLTLSAIVYRSFKNADALCRDSEALDLLHAAIGISGEAGELLDAVKKHWVYERPLDRANVIEELGDIEYYMEAMRQRLGVERGEVIRTLQNKLDKRYPNGYTDASAQARADKES